MRASRTCKQFILFCDMPLTIVCAYRNEDTFITTLKINKAIYALCPQLRKARRLLKGEPEVFMRLCKMVSVILSLH